MYDDGPYTEKFKNVPVEMLMNSFYASYTHYYDPDKKCFVLRDACYDCSKKEPNLIKLPSVESNAELAWKVFWLLLDEEDIAFIENNCNDDEDSPNYQELAFDTYLYDYFVEAKKRTLPVILDSWERKHNLNIDWQHVLFVEVV